MKKFIFKYKLTSLNILKFIICLLYLFFFAAHTENATANSGEVEIYSGGSARMVSGEHKSIQMKSELIEMYLYSGYYRVIATFYFDNHGDSTTVIMGFPEISETSYKKDVTIFRNNESVFLSVKCFVDGEEIEIKPYPVKKTGKKDNKYLALWVHEVHFEKKQKRKVVIDYTVENSNSSEIEYHFTGGNWFKNVEDSKLIMHPMGYWEPSVPFPEGVRYENGVYIFEKNNWEAEYTFKWQADVKTVFESTLTRKGIYEVYKGEINGFTYSSFYFFKDYQGNVLYVSPVNIIFPPHKYDHNSHSMKHYTDYGLSDLYYTFMENKGNNILTIDRKGKENGEYIPIIDYIDLNNSYKPGYVFRYHKKYEERGYTYLFKKNIGKSGFWYVMHIYNPVEVIRDKNKIFDDFTVLDSNANILKQKINNNYGFLEKLFKTGDYLDNLEAYVLQMIFMNKEEEG